MMPRDIVLEVLHHRQPTIIPYTLSFENDVAERLDAHYGSPAWRERLTPFMAHVHAVDTDYKEPLDGVRFRDAYGGIWRHDYRPWHLEQPPLAQPSFDGYAFPAAEIFFRPAWREEGQRIIAANRDRFILAHLGWGLFERSWTLRGFENLLTDVVAAPDFFEEALDRLTELYLAFIEYTAELRADAILFGDDWGDQQCALLALRKRKEVIISPDRNGEA